MRVLKQLWGESPSFPKVWVPSSVLLRITRQKYFDRRIRELRDNKGCDIETSHVSGEHSYRLVSSKLKTANPRIYLSSKDKKSLFKSAKNQCQVCGVTLDKGVRGLQADHKIPLIRGGDHNSSNWQALCNECNVAKRRSCQGCQDKCLECPWAFPEKIGVPVPIRVSRADHDFIKQQSAGNPKWLEGEVKTLLDKLKSGNGR